MADMRWQDWTGPEAATQDGTKQQLILPEDPLTYAILSIPISVQQLVDHPDGSEEPQTTTQAIRQQVRAGKHHGRHLKED